MAAPRRHRVWWLVAAIILVVVGGGIVVYPFIPAARYALDKPKPTLPYATRLSLPASASRLAALDGLPTIGTKPTPKDNRLVIPSINVDMPIYEGPDQRVLDRGGIWHIPGTSDPVKGGNMVVSGHRWKYLPPSSMTLYLLDKVKIGEPIIVYWRGVEYDYTVRDRKIITPDQVDILNDTPQPQLTIFTCTPLFSTKQRLVLFADLVS